MGIFNKLFSFSNSAEKSRDEQESFEKKEIKYSDVKSLAVVIKIKGEYRAFDMDGNRIKKISKQTRVNAFNGQYPLGQKIGKSGKATWRKVADVYLVNYINKEKFMGKMDEYFNKSGQTLNPTDLEWIFIKADLYKEYNNDEKISIKKMIEIKKEIVARQAEERKAERARETEKRKAERARETREHREKEKQRKNTLIKKYGKENGNLIFKGKLTESECIRKNNLIKSYGDEFGMAVFSNKILNGMRKEMVAESIGNPQYKDKDKWYFGTPFNKYILFESNKDYKICNLSEGIWIGMPKAMLVASYGKPKDEKKNVTKKVVKTKLYFGARKTRQKTTVYKFEARLEDDVEVGFRELE